jgi:polyphosphate kinase
MSPKEAKPSYPYFNRELSWLAFNRRVLEQAMNKDYPILERMKYLSFVSSNLDEFFEIRVSGLMQQVDSNVGEYAYSDGIGRKDLLKRTLEITQKMVRDEYRCWNMEIVPELGTNGILFKAKGELNEKEMIWAEKYFKDEVYPVLTPLAIDSAHPFPQILNKSLNIIVGLEDETVVEGCKMAIIPVPRILPRVISVGEEVDGKQTYVFLSTIITLFAQTLFPGYPVYSAHPFRITRNNDLYIDEEEMDNLLTEIEEELWKMRKNSPVRLEISKQVNDQVLQSLLKATDLHEDLVYKVDGPINLSRLMSAYGEIDRPDLKFESFTPFLPNSISERSKIFNVIKKEDQLLHHPYESFNPVVDFVKQAARDPLVFAIKQTLYRTSGDSPIVAALKEASLNGKQVTALIELKARFDEANNIEWARQLEEVGVHVVYGLVGLKTHCKCCLIVRRESDGLRRYVHLGTGNYNPKTAKFYTDFSYFTAKKSFTGEVADLFNTLTGFAKSPKFKKLLVAPFNLHDHFIKLIRSEAQNAKAGKPARIIVKVNSLIDTPIINELYEASQSGVKIELIVRGICGLVPNIKGVSERIKVRSILGPYLEHSRLFYFENGEGEPAVFIGSSDWMPRNFYRRIECVFPIENPDLKAKVFDALDFALKDNVAAKLLRSNGSYTPAPKGRGKKEFSSQDHFVKTANLEREKEKDQEPLSPL